MRAVDAAGNRDASPASTSIIADSVAGAVGAFAWARAAFSISGSRSSSSVQCRLDAGEWTACPAKLAYHRLSTTRLPRLLVQSNVEAAATVELRRGRRPVRRWTAPVVRGSNAISVPRAAGVKLGAARYTITIGATNASGRSTDVRRRFDAVRRARR